METDVAKCLFYVATGKTIRLPSSLGGQVGEGLESGKLGNLPHAFDSKTCTARHTYSSPNWDGSDNYCLTGSICLLSWWYIKCGVVYTQWFLRFSKVQI